MNQISSAIIFASEKTSRFIRWNILIRLIFWALFGEQKMNRKAVRFQRTATTWVAKIIWCALVAFCVRYLALPFWKTLMLLAWPTTDEYILFFESKNFFLCIVILFLAGASYVVIKYGPQPVQK